MTKIIENNDERILLLVPLSSITDMADPVRTPPWRTDTPLTKIVVQRCLSDQRYLQTPASESEQDTLRHAMRIAWLHDNSWSDAISLEINEGSEVWPITDGNHRLYAAILRGDDEILVEVSGSLDMLEKHFSIEL